jgi:hypothetical protein
MESKTLLVCIPLFFFGTGILFFFGSIKPLIVVFRYPTPCHSEERSDEESLDASPDDRQLRRFREERLRPVTRQAGLVRQGFRDFSLALEMTWRV